MGSHKCRKHDGFGFFSVNTVRREAAGAACALQRQHGFMQGHVQPSEAHLWQYLGNTVKRCADVDDVEALPMLCIDAENLLGGRRIHQQMIDLF